MVEAGEQEAGVDGAGDGLAEVSLAPGTEITVVDIAPAATPFPHQPEGEHYTVLRGPCYLDLASVLAAPEAPDGIILVPRRQGAA